MITEQCKRAAQVHGQCMAEAYNEGDAETFFALEQLQKEAFFHHRDMTPPDPDPDPDPRPDPDPDPDPGGDPGPPATGEMRSQVARHGIIWTFDRPYLTFSYANGDPGVVGPVRIVNISPGVSISGGRVSHGSMVNPRPDWTQGYDSSARDGAKYVPALNVGRSLPIDLPPGSSLVSTRSVAKAAGRPQLADAAVLTVVYIRPEEGSFRPAYCGTNKSSPGNLSDIDWTKLPGKAMPTGSSWLGGVEAPLDPVEPWRAVERVWLDHVQDWPGRVIHPHRNMPVYGAEIEEAGGACALFACSNSGTREEREKTAIGLIQVGIDLHGMIEAGADPWHWNTGGNHGGGRLGPILFAGLLLGRNDLLNVRTLRPKTNYNELGQVYYLPNGTAEWCDQANRGRRFCDQRWSVPKSDPAWTHLRYRTSDTARARWAWAAFYELVGIKDKVAHPAFFDYQKRYYEIQVLGYPNAPQQTHTKMPWTLAAWKQITAA